MSKKPTPRPPSTQIQPESSAQGNDSDIPLGLPAEFEKLPEETKTAVIKAIYFKGPLPPPSVLRQYEEQFPGAGERILTMTEKEQTHRHNWDRQMLEYQGKEVQNGQMYGFVLGALAICGGAFCAYIGQPVVAGILVGTTVVGIVTAFIQGRSDSDE